MLRVGSTVCGVESVPRAIAFWCAALGYRLREEPDIDWAVLVPASGEGVQIAIDKADEPTTGQRPIDIISTFMPTTRAERLGDS